VASEERHIEVAYVDALDLPGIDVVCEEGQTAVVVGA
jgi:hypothetical protein